VLVTVFWAISPVTSTRVQLKHLRPTEIQNELFDAAGQSVKESVLKDVKQATVWSAIAY